MLWWLAQNAVLGTVLAVLVGVTCRVFHFRPAVRHALWLIVLLKLVAPPLLPWSWSVAQPQVDGSGDFEHAQPSEDRRDLLIASIQPPSEISPKDLHAKWLALDCAGIVAEPIIPNAERTMEPATTIPAEPAAKTAADTAGPLSATLAWFSGPAAELGLRVWLGAVAVMAGLQLVRTIRFRRRLARGRPAPGPLTGLVAEMAKRLGIRPPATVVVPGLCSPMVWGLGRPTLLWPASLIGRLSQDCQRAVVVHELAHLRRRDHWVGWLQLLVGCVWWWNPLFRWINNQVGRNAELACDAWVIQVLPAARRAYAEALLEVTQLTSRSAAPLPALGMAGGHPDFERRLIMIMRDRVPCRVPMLGLALLGLLAMVTVPGWSLSQQPVEVKTEIKKVDKKKTDKTPASKIENADAADLYIVTGEVVDAVKSGPDGDRLDRLEKQLEALLHEVKAMRSGSGQHTFKEVKVDAKSAATSAAPKVGGSVHYVDPKIVAVEAASGNRHEYTWIAQGEGGDAVTLTRATYKMPKDKAEALVKFLSDQVKGQVLETKVDGEGIVVTTTPHIQRTIHDFINLVQGGGKQTFQIELKGADLKLADPHQKK